MTRVVVAGAGFAGLAAALFLARRGQIVTLVERDGAPSDGTPSDDVNRWLHPGVSQARQSHALLGRARRVLADETPDVLASLLARGVHEVPAVVGAEPGVTLMAGDAVVGLRVSTSGSVPVVTGVRLFSGVSIDADLVIDASGRRSALPEWFAQAGLRAPVEDRQDCGFFYLTRFYSVRPGCQIPTSNIPASIALDYATVFALGADNDTFSLTVTLSVNDPYRKALRDHGCFEAFLHAVPHSAPWIQVGSADQRHRDDVQDREPAPSAHHQRRPDRRRSRRDRRRGTPHQSHTRPWHLDGAHAFRTETPSRHSLPRDEAMAVRMLSLACSPS